jgi:hypothetical protein
MESSSPENLSGQRAQEASSPWPTSKSVSDRWIPGLPRDFGSAEPIDQSFLPRAKLKANHQPSGVDRRFVSSSHASSSI